MLLRCYCKDRYHRFIDKIPLNKEDHVFYKMDTIPDFFEIDKIIKTEENEWVEFLVDGKKIKRLLKHHEKNNNKIYCKSQIKDSYSIVQKIKCKIKNSN